MSTAEFLSKKSSGLPSGRRARRRARLFSQGISAPRLPGVGPYTAAAVKAFAFNKPTVFIETNIRTVFLYYCFGRLDISSHSTKKIADKEILPLIEKALKKSGMEPREFYARLMDLGTMLKKQGIRLNSKSAHYNKQSKFEGSYRQLRGQILRALLLQPSTLNQLLKITGRSRKDVVPTIASLSKEGVIKLKRNKFFIADFLELSYCFYLL